MPKNTKKCAIAKLNYVINKTIVSTGGPKKTGGN